MLGFPLGTWYVTANLPFALRYMLNVIPVIDLKIKNISLRILHTCS